MTLFPKWFNGLLSWRSAAGLHGLLSAPTFEFRLIAKHDILLVLFFLPSVPPGPVLCPHSLADLLTGLRSPSPKEPDSHGKPFWLFL